LDNSIISRIFPLREVKNEDRLGSASGMRVGVKAVVEDPKHSTRTSHPPERGGESSIGERRCDAEAQRRRSPGRDHALELSGQHA
jgi:hypothetical protein